MGLELCFALQKVEYASAFREAKTRVWIASKQAKAALVFSVQTQACKRYENLDEYTYTSFTAVSITVN
jgi:hypothetical protein